MALNEEMDVYGKSDRLTADVLEQTARRFNTARRKVNGLADFDRLNVLLRAVYQEAYWDMQRLMKEIGRSQYDDLTDARKRRERFEDIFLLVLFDESDPITGYILGNEVERKRERLYEQVVSIKSHKTAEQKVGSQETDYGDTIVPSQDAEIRKAFDRAYNLWSHMVQEYSVRAVDVARLMAYEDMGVKRVQWNAEIDDKVCDECLSRHGRKYLLHRVPAKPHWNCRCWLTAVPEDKKNSEM